MRIATISRGGQISIPADVRHRWGVRRVVLTESGDALLIEPLPDDPIAAAMGSLADSAITSDEARRQLREEDRERTRRRGWG